MIIATPLATQLQYNTELSIFYEKIKKSKIKNISIFIGDILEQVTSNLIGDETFYFYKDDLIMYYRPGNIGIEITEEFYDMIQFKNKFNPRLHYDDIKKILSQQIKKKMNLNFYVSIAN